jgi:hypothetical protein
MSPASVSLAEARLPHDHLGAPLQRFVSAAPNLLHGLRLWAAVCLALYVAFWLELDNV